jgi:hypothetical protein
VNRIQQFRNIASRAFGVGLDPAPKDGSTLAAAERIAGVEFFYFPSEKGGFYRDRSFFSPAREQNKFHIFCHFYHRSPRGGLRGRGIFGC